MASLVRLVLPTESRDGWIIFGDSEQLPVPTERDLCYPACDFSDSVTSQPPRWHQGVRYPLHLEGYTELGATASIPVYEPWREWCRNQTPVPVRPDLFSCAHTLGEGPNADACVPSDGGVMSPAECCHIGLCQSLKVCECTARECVASRERSQLTLFEVDGGLVVALDDGTVVEMRPVPGPAEPPPPMDQEEPSPPTTTMGGSSLLDVELGLPVPFPLALDASLDVSLDAHREALDAGPDLPDPADAATDADAKPPPPAMDGGQAQTPRLTSHQTG